MRTGGKSALTVRGACLVAGLTFCLAVASEELPLQVVISDQAVSIRAENQPIRAVLEELSWHARLMVVSEQALDDIVTVDIDQTTLPLAIRSLLRQQSYMLHQVSPVSGTDNSAGKCYGRLWIFSDESGVRQPDWSTYANLWTDDRRDAELVDYQILAASDATGDREDAMGEIGGREAIRYLRQAMTDENHTVREAAAEWLTELTWQRR